MLLAYRALCAAWGLALGLKQLKRVGPVILSYASLELAYADCLLCYRHRRQCQGSAAAKRWRPVPCHSQAWHGALGACTGSTGAEPRSVLQLFCL